MTENMLEIQNLLIEAERRGAEEVSQLLPSYGKAPPFSWHFTVLL